MASLKDSACQNPSLLVSRLRSHPHGAVAALQSLPSLLFLQKAPFSCHCPARALIDWVSYGMESTAELLNVFINHQRRQISFAAGWLWAANHGRDGLMLTHTSAIIFSINYLLFHPALTSLLISGHGWLPHRAGGGLGQRVSSVTSHSGARLLLVPKAPLYVSLSPPWCPWCPSPRAGPPPLVPVNHLPLTLHPQEQVRL